MKPTKMTTKNLDYCWLTAAALSRNKTSTALERGLGETHGRQNAQITIGVYLTIIPAHYEYLDAKDVE